MAKSYEETLYFKLLNKHYTKHELIVMIIQLEEDIRRQNNDHTNN